MMKRISFQTRSLAFLLSAWICLSFAPPHHGWSNYDQNKTLNFTGEILESTYENPHGMLKFRVENDTWTVVLAPPARMEARGLSKAMLAKGATANVVGYPHKKEKGEMRAERITIGDKTTELR